MHGWSVHISSTQGKCQRNTLHALRNSSFLTSRTNSRGVFIVIAVVVAPSIVPTIDNRTFVTFAVYPVQPNLTTTRAKSGKPWGTNSLRISKLATNDSSVANIPRVITNSSPCIIVKYFYPSLRASRSSNQSQTWRWKGSLSCWNFNFLVHATKDILHQLTSWMD